MGELKTKNLEQEEQRKTLMGNIELQQKAVDELNDLVETEKKINKVEEEKHRKLSHINAALRAKLEFIQQKYDFTTNVNHLSTDDFKTLITSNDLVSLDLLLIGVGESHSEGFHRETRQRQGGSAEIRSTQVHLLIDT